jgi:hypothetical protein
MELELIYHPKYGTRKTYELFKEEPAAPVERRPPIKGDTMRNIHAISRVILLFLICSPLFGNDIFQNYQYVSFHDGVGMVEVLPPIIPRKTIEGIMKKYPLKGNPDSANHVEIPQNEILVPEEIRGIKDVSVVSDDGCFKVKVKCFALRKIPGTDEVKFLLIFDSPPLKPSFGLTSIFGFLPTNAKLFSKWPLKIPTSNYWKIYGRTISDLKNDKTTLVKDLLERLSFELYSFPYFNKKNGLLAVGTAGESDSDEKIQFPPVSFVGTIDNSGSIKNEIFPPSDDAWYQVLSFCDLNGDGFSEVLITDNVGDNDPNIFLIFWNQGENKFDKKFITKVYDNEVY